MAKKSKTQRAKASEARAARKEDREQKELASVDATDDVQDMADAAGEKPKKPILASIKKEDSDAGLADTTPKKETKKTDSKPAKKRLQFFRDVKTELVRVTWPTRVDVMRWTGVVIVALLFFGIFVAILDNLIVTPLLVWISGSDMPMFDFGSWFNGGSDAAQSTDLSNVNSSLTDASASDAAQAVAGGDSASASAGAQAPTEGSQPAGQEG